VQWDEAWNSDVTDIYFYFYELRIDDHQWQDKYNRSLLEIVVGQRSLNQMLVSLFCASLSVESPMEYGGFLFYVMELVQCDME